MKRNLTVSLSDEDWRKVKAIAESQGETYRAALAPHARFLARRAGALARAGRGRKTPA